MVYAVIGAIVLLFYFLVLRKKLKLDPDLIVIPPRWRTILQQKVDFYQHLNEEDKVRFEKDCYLFLNEVKITGIETDVTLVDRLLVASSAVIPIFGFPEWSYQYLHEVILYPSAFDRTFQFNNPHEVITGMVGIGVMEGKVILSKPALHYGFQNTEDKHNVGIHEFVHLLDKEDGIIDGVPLGYNEKKYALPWITFIKSQIKEIVDHKSDINDYGATNNQEFFAVASEYFFETPHLLKRKHPELYEALSEIFNQDLATTQLKIASDKQARLGRNSPCPCGSGLKYKKCCLK